jgi:anaerobic selenocysteine-containing dehydrogenase
MAIQHIPTYCAMCISRYGVVATVEDGILTQVTADPEHPNGYLCVKGSAAPELVYSPDRLSYPMRRTRPKGEADPGWVRITWDEALALTASRLGAIKARHGPEAVVFGCATPAGTAAADFFPWVQRLANAFGSPNILFANHLCAWHRVGGAQYTYGSSMPRPDYEQTRCVLLWGANPQASQPADAMRISRAKTRGAKLIVIDPCQGRYLAARAAGMGLARARGTTSTSAGSNPSAPCWRKRRRSCRTVSGWVWVSCARCGAVWSPNSTSRRMTS